jgi:hypothetical protein
VSITLREPSKPDAHASQLCGLCKCAYAINNGYYQWTLHLTGKLFQLKCTDLVEANVVSVQPEALPAHVDGVLPDDAVLICADTALTATLALLLWVGVC